MMIWQEPRPGTKGARIVRMLRRPEGATLRELAASVKWKTASVRGHLSTIRSDGLDVLTREEECRGRVWYVVKVDRRKRQPDKVEDQPLRPALLFQAHLDRLGVPYTSHGVQDYALAAFALAYDNPLIGAAIDARLAKR